MKMKNLMHFEAKTHKGQYNNVLADSVINFLDKDRYSISLGKKVKYSEMDLTQFINSIAVDLNELERLRMNFPRQSVA